jgi:hypothetical protein
VLISTCSDPIHGSWTVANAAPRRRLRRSRLKPVVSWTLRALAGPAGEHPRHASSGLRKDPGYANQVLRVVRCGGCQIRQTEGVDSVAAEGDSEHAV